MEAPGNGLLPKTRRMFPNNFRQFPKIFEDNRRLPKILEEDPNMFRQLIHHGQQILVQFKGQI